jgi:universal stress protein A
MSQLHKTSRAFRFNKILCPLDFDQNSIRALRLASGLSRHHNATLHLLHVIDEAIPAKTEVTAPYDRMEVAVRGRLERLAHQHVDPRVRDKLHVETGDTAVRILDVAKRVRADLIVMATHGRKGLPRLVIGSVAERIIRQAQCPVLIVRPTVRRAQVR